MNYITEINRFYDWLETNTVSDSSIVLWHALMHINNKCGWKQEFTVAISTLELKTGLSKSSILRSRNVLQQSGRINFRTRNGQQSAVYDILAFHSDAQTVTQTVAQSVTQSEAQTVTQSVPITKLKETKTKKTKLPSGGKPPGKRKDDFSKVLYWGKIVDAWFVFYKEKFQVEPTFNGMAAKNLKLIIDRLKQLSEKSNQQWTELYALRVTDHFFTKAITDEWLKQNFLLNNLYSKFDSIVQKANGTNNDHKKQTGSSVNTGSMLSKINAMPD